MERLWDIFLYWREGEKCFVGEAGLDGAESHLVGMESSSATVFRAALCAASLVGTYSARGAGSVLVVRASKPVAIVKRAVSAAVVIVILRRLEKALGTVGEGDRDSAQDS